MSTQYFWSKNNDATNHCTGSAAGGDHDALLEETGPATGPLSDSVPGQATDRIGYLGTTPTGEPGITDWGTSVAFSCLVDVISVGAKIDMAGQFLRRLAACGARANLGTSAEVDPPQVGVNTLSITGVTSDDGITDRLQVRLLLDNTNHSAQSINIDYDGVDTRVIAPWTLDGADDLATKQILLGLNTTIMITGG